MVGAREMNNIGFSYKHSNNYQHKVADKEKQHLGEKILKLVKSLRGTSETRDISS